MLDQVLSVFGIVPDFDLNIMTHGATLAQVTTRALEGLEPILAAEKPDWVLAQGDTTTTFVAALGAFYHRAKFGHVEAGPAHGQRLRPVPRRNEPAADHAPGDTAFPADARSRRQPARRGRGGRRHRPDRQHRHDALLEVAASRTSPDDPCCAEILADPRRVSWSRPTGARTGASRWRGSGRPCAKIVDAHPDTVAVVALHRNPLVRETLSRSWAGTTRIRLIEPPDYAPFVKLQQKATLILTDSGGVQEEAPSLGKPVLVLRETTERPEGVAAGTAKLVGTDRARIVAEASRLLADPAAYAAMAHAVSPYGDGQAAARIADALEAPPAIKKEWYL